MFVVFIGLVVSYSETIYARGVNNNSYVNLPFKGHYRASAKTSFANASKEPCTDLSDVMSTLVSDKDMRKKYKHIGNKRTTMKGRVAEEQRNVCVTGFLYAVKFEHGKNADNDFHLILGADMKGKGPYMTAEVSGVPKLGNKTPFIHVRHELFLVVGDKKLSSSYTRFKPPVKVRVVGSLFFDGDHTAGQVGPKYAKPKSVWEIHPVRSIWKE